MQYSDPWPGSPAEDIATVTTDSSGDTDIDWTSHEFDRDLLTGTSRMWFVSTTYVDRTDDTMVDIDYASFLFEYEPIMYDDTDVP